MQGEKLISEKDLPVIDRLVVDNQADEINTLCPALSLQQKRFGMPECICLY